MSHGAVPSGSYDIVKYARGENYINLLIEIKPFFKVSGYKLSPLREPDLAFLSESDIECLNESISNYGSMSFADLKN